MHWESECPKMATIYGGGQVTITAPAAVDSESGFLELRFLGKRALSCALRYRRRDGTTTGKVRVWYPALTHNSRRLWSREENSVLDTRANGRKFFPSLDELVTASEDRNSSKSEESDTVAPRSIYGRYIQDITDGTRNKGHG
jgi:hypothetical protein